MGKDNELLIKINGNAKQFVDELDRVNKKTKDLQKGLSTVAKTSAVAFVALAGAVGLTVLRFSEFEKTFTNVQTLLDKSSFSTKTLKNGIEGLRKGVIALGAKSGESFENLNEGLFNLISGGVKADDAMETLAAATRLATAGATDTNTAVKALTSTLTAFGDEAGTAQEISEKFFTAQKFGVTTVGELATSFNKVGGLAKTLGISFDETLASLSSLTADGAKPTAEAATQLRAAFNSIILVQSKLKNENAGVRDALDLQNIKSRGLVKSLDLLKIATGGDVVEMQRLLGSSEALQAVLSLTGGQSELVAKQIDALGNASERAATFQDAFATKQATTDQATKRLKSSLDGIAVTFGSAFAPAINAAADVLSSIATTISELDKRVVQTAASIIAFTLALTGLVTVSATLALIYIKVSSLLRAYTATTVTATAASKLLGFSTVQLTFTQRVFAKVNKISIAIQSLLNTQMSIGTIATKAYSFAVKVASVSMRIAGIAVRFMLGPIGLLITALGFLAVVFRNEIGAAIKAFGEGVVLAAKQAGEGFTTMFRLIKASLSASLAAVSTFVDAVSTSMTGVADLFRGLFGGDIDLIASGLDKLKGKVGTQFSDIGKVAREAFDKSILEGDDFNPRASAKAKEAESKKDTSAADEAAAAAEKEQAKVDAIAAVKAKADEAALLKDQEKLDKEIESALENLEQRRILNEEFALLDTETQAELDEEELLKLQEHVLTKGQVRDQEAQANLKRKIDERNQFLKDELKFGTTTAKLNQFFRDEDVKGAGNAANQLVALTSSKNSTLKGIGKAASLVQVGIKTAEGAISAYTALAGIPIVGPGLGIAAATALTLFGAEQAANIASAQRGGFVPPTSGGSRDRTLLAAEPGELVVPKAITSDFIQSVGRPDTEAAGDAGGTESIVTLGFRDEAFEIIEQKLLERRALGSGGL